MKTLLYLFFTFVISGVLYSQPFTNIQINSSGGPEEPSICINPKNTNQLVAGANINYSFYSTNGGFNWFQSIITSTYSVWGDPCISIDTAGNFYYYHLTNPSGGLFIDRMVSQKSTNGGANWSNGSYTGYNPPKQQDKEWAAVDWTHGPRGNWMYLTWTQFDMYGTSNPNDSSIILFSRTTDAGITWSSPLRLNQKAGDCVDADNTVEGAVPVVGPNGELYVAWAGPNIINSQFGIFFTKSTDGGNSWLPNNIYVCDQPGGWDYNIPGIYRANGLPVTCCDVSNGPHRGNIYINWTDETSATDHDVRLIKSTNGGLNWSTIRRVNDDAPGREQFFTWMTVDQTTGFIYLIFYDRRNTTGNNTEVYMARSTDGGDSFTNMLVSSSSFLPTSTVFFGDYTNIAAANGHIRPIWTRLQSGSLSVWTAIIDFPVAVLQNGNNEIPKSYALLQNFPNPFNPSTTIKFSIPSGHNAENVQLKIYDVLGKEVATLVNENGMTAGNYSIEWNASNYSSGIYFYTLRVGTFNETRKMILSK